MKRLPVSLARLWAEWTALSSRSGLDVGTEADLPAVLGYAPLPDELFRPGEVETVLDSLIGLARKRTPIVRFTTDADGRPILVADLAGRDEDVAETIAAFMRAIEVAQRSAILDELAERGRFSVGRFARRWSTSRSELYRWKDAADHALVVVAERETVPKTADPGTAASPRPTDDCGVALVIPPGDERRKAS